MGWIALSIAFLALAVGTGLTNIARSLAYGMTLNHRIGKLTIEEEKAKYPSHDDRTHIRQMI